jgi:hypothetical protein
MKNIHEKIVQYLENNTKKGMFWFYAATLTRILVPIILFQKMSPFYAILFNEIILDYCISPQHYVIYTMPKKERKWANHYYSDKPLDTWGFLMALQPIIFKSNKYYDMFEGYRDLLFYLYVYRLVGIIIFYKVKLKQVFIPFANFFLTTYVIVSFFRTFMKEVSNKTINKFIILGFIFSIFKEYQLHGKQNFNEHDKEFSLL